MDYLVSYKTPNSPFVTDKVSVTNASPGTWDAYRALFDHDWFQDT